MTSGGARGKTAEEFEEVLRLKLPRDRVHPTYARLVRALQPQRGDGERKVHELAIANGLWPDGRFPLRPEFAELCRVHYDAPFVEPLDYLRSPEPARRTINDWVSRRTHGKIPELTPRGLIDSTTMLVLTDALWFQAHWADEFPKDETVKAPFHASATRTVNAPLMHGCFDNLPYLEAPGFQAIELRTMAQETSMVILLPQEAEGLRRLERQLDRKTLEGWLDEEGTEGAAATAVIIFLGITIDESQPVDFRADHPFLFLLRHRTTGAILFLGRVVDPAVQA